MWMSGACFALLAAHCESYKLLHTENPTVRSTHTIDFFFLHDRCLQTVQAGETGKCAHIRRLNQRVEWWPDQPFNESFSIQLSFSQSVVCVT